MGSMTKFDSERRDVVRERRNARIERKQQRREARERKRAQISVAPPAQSPIQRAGQEHVDAAVDRIVSQALERHDQMSAATMPRPGSAPQAGRAIESPAVGDQGEGAAQPSATPSFGLSNGRPPVMSAAARVAAEAERRPRRESDIAAFRRRRRQAADDARAEARERIARSGELACVADALAALAHPGARPWDAERQELERAFESGRIVNVGTVARRALWVISRDAARRSRRARRDPDLALAACVAYAIIARLPRSALRSAQRTRPAPDLHSTGQRPFWR